MSRFTFLISVLALALTGSLGLTFLAMLLSPSDPGRSNQRDQLVRHQESAVGWAKAPRVVHLIASGESFTFGREPAVTTFSRGVLRTATVQGVGLPLGWALGAGLGLLLGGVRGRWIAGVGMAGLLTFVLTPAPVKVAAARVMLLETGLFSIGANESGFGAFWAAALTLSVLTAPTIAVHQAVMTGRALRRSDVVFARAIGLPWRTQWWLVWRGSGAFWRSQAALMLVSLIEGSLLIEEAFQVKGIGLAAFQAAVRCDAALLILIVAISCLLVDVGVLWSQSRLQHN